MKALRNARGFTLIEMMVAVVIGAVILAAAYQVLVGQSRVYETQEQTIDMQQSVRAALDFMCREMRMAGYGVASGTDIFSDLINNDGTDPDIDDETDAITFRGNTEYASLVVNIANSGDSSIDVFPAPVATMEFSNSAVIDILAGDKVLLQGGLTITNNPDGAGYGDPADPTADPTVLTIDSPLDTGVPAGSYVTIQPRNISYRVRNNILERDEGGGFQDLIEDVEDLQLVYAFDDDLDGDLETDAVTGDTVWAVDGDNNGFLETRVQADGATVPLASPVDISGDQTNCRIRAVKVSILVRTARENPDPRFRGQFSRPRVEDRLAAGANDGFRRRLLQSTVKIRNLGL